MKSFELLGEFYLSINYKDILYINDTGRNWRSDQNNIKDKVKSEFNSQISNGNELFYFLKDVGSPKIIFQIHPERWHDNILSWSLHYIFDTFVNISKFIYIKIKKFTNG